ncbi:MAG: MmgE/PrpD family protein [Thermodesulfobacteriota bacterium]|nr:MmgE/PrpD family protein [Thermodesulfobacteriota bacterium]
MKVTETLARFVLNTTLADIPAQAQEIGKRVILDCLGVALAGSRDPLAKIMTGFIKELGGRPKVSVWGKKFKTSGPLAALANGTFGHALDYDDINRSMRGHPTVPVLPAALAMGEELGASGRKVLEAFLIGVEVETKLGAGINPHLFEGGWHPTAILGAMGAAAASAKLLKLSLEKVCFTLGIAASLASGLRQNFGSMTKPLHAGHAAQNGVTAAKLAQKGFTADREIVEAKLGYANAFAGAGKYDLNKIVANLGQPFDIISPGVGLKRYPSCARTHPAIDAMLDMVVQNDIHSEDVKSISCAGSYTTPTMLIHSRPRTALEGKFSMEFCLALALLERKVELPHFNDQKVQDPKIQRYIPKVSFFIRPDLNNIENSGNPSTTVKILMKDGREFTKTVDEARGTPGNPLTQEEVRDKYRQCVKGIQAKKEMEKTIEIVENLEALKKISALADLLRGPDKK